MPDSKETPVSMADRARRLLPWLGVGAIVLIGLAGYGWYDLYVPRHATIFEAMQRRDVDDIKRFIRRDANVLKRTNFVGESPLEIEPDPQVVRMMLDRLPHRGRERQRVLDAALQNAAGYELELMTILIEAGANVNARDRYGRTPLHLSTTAGQIDEVALLIRHKADVNARDDKGRSPLHYLPSRDLRAGESLTAAALDIAERLLGAGADIDARDNEGLTPAASYVHSYDLESVAAMLLGRGASFDVPCDRDGTLLDCCLRSSKLAPIVLARGANANQLNADGVSPLDEAIRHEDVALIRQLIAHGADVNAISAYRQTPLLQAIYLDNMDIVKLLLKSGANPNAKGDFPGLPIELALDGDQIALLRTLIDAGANVNAKLEGNYRALDVAIARNNTEMIEMLKQAGAQPFPMADP